MGWCAKVGHWQALVELLAIVWPQEDKLTSVIRSACAENQQHCLQLLLDYGVKPDGMLECAVFRGAACAVKLLLSARADASEGCSEALHSAMFYDRPQVVKALLDGRADPKSWDNQGAQPLHTYAHYGCRLSIKELIAARADVNGRAKRTTKIARGKTPLMIAAYLGQIETIKVLLGAGAYTDLKDLNGRTALDTAIHHGDEDATKILRATTCASPRSSTPLVGIPEVRFLLSPDKPAR